MLTTDEANNFPLVTVIISMLKYFHFLSNIGISTEIVSTPISYTIETSSIATTGVCLYCPI